MPILRSELVAASRRGRVQSERAWFALVLMAIVLGTFGTWYYWESGNVSHELMARVAVQSFYWAVLVHSTLIAVSATAGALSIAGEKDRQTLGFLLATPLNNAEIILGKLVVRMVSVLNTVAAGLPVVLLLDTLGGIDLRLILLAYGGILSTSFFVLAMAIWCSTGAENGRRAHTTMGFVILFWLVVPFWIGSTPILSRLGIRPPAFLMTVNLWILASSPLNLLARFAALGAGSARALVYGVAWMSGLQVAGGLAFVGAAILRLRSAYRANMGEDGNRLARRLNLPSLRLFPKRPVGDDPILWKAMEIHPRANLLLQILGLLIAAAVWGALATSTFYFARLAFVELWNHGYHSGAPSTRAPELNLAVGFFSAAPLAGEPANQRRVDFNLFIRLVTMSSSVFLAVLTAAMAFGTIAEERRRGTWSSLTATPLSGREILKSLMLSALWRLRWLLITPLFLWTLGLVAGAIHPLGYAAAVLLEAASTWWLLSAGFLTAIRSIDQAEREGRPGDSMAVAASNGLGRLILVPTLSAAVPILFSRQFGSIFWGALSPPFMIGLVLVSWREMRSSLQGPVYPLLGWLGPRAAGSPRDVALALVIGVCVPLLWGYRNWRISVAHFDRLVGRPWRDADNLAETGAHGDARLTRPSADPGLTSV